MRQRRKSEVAGGRIDVSLTGFIDFVLRVGMQRLQLAEVLRRQSERGYRPECDYYKTMRESITSGHRDGKPVADLESMAQSFPLAFGRRENGLLIARGYQRFWARHFAEVEVKWVRPPRGAWEHQGLRVRVNPEVALWDGHENHIIKLYLKKAVPNPAQVPLILHLMQVTVKPQLQQSVVSLLDVRRSRLYTESTFEPRRSALLEGEAAALMQMCRSLIAMTDIDGGDSQGRELEV